MNRLLPLAVLLLVALPAEAQDPFDSIVANSGDVTARVRRLLPSSSPDEATLRTYLEGVQALSLSLDAELNDGQRRTWTRLGEKAYAPTGTRLAMKAGFSKPRDGRSAVLTSLSVEPSRSLHFGDTRLHSIELDGYGNLNVSMHQGDRYVDLQIHKIYTDRAGNLTFRTHARNMGSFKNRWVPDFRITPDGRVQTNYKNAFFSSNRGWKTSRDAHGNPVRIGRGLPIDDWPPSLGDLAKLFDGEGEGRKGNFLGSLPIGDLSLELGAKAGPTLLRPVSDDGWLALREGSLDLTANGRVKLGRFEADPERKNTLKLKGRFDGIIDTDSLKAKVLALEIDVDGTHSASFGGEGDPELGLEGEATAHVDVADVVATGANGERTTIRRAKLDLEGLRTQTHDMRGGALNALEGVEVDGQLTELVVERDSTTVTLPAVHVAGQGATQDGKVAVTGSATLTAAATVDAPLGEDLTLNSQLGEGTRIDVDTGLVSKLGVPRRVRAHLLVEGTSVAYKDLLTANLDGRGTIDLESTLGFRVDPAKLKDAKQPVPLDLKLSFSFDPGSSLSFGRAGAKQPTKVTFKGRTKVEVDLNGEVDPQTGAPKVSGFDGVKVRFKGEGRDTSKLRGLARSAVFLDDLFGLGVLEDAKVQFTPQGLEIEHSGKRVTLERAN